MSTYLSSRSSSVTSARSGSVIVCTAAAAMPERASASWITCVSARLLWNVSLPPRRIAALPVLRQSVAMSIVTFGRAS